MNNKEEEILKEIRKYYQENHTMPSRRYLQKIFNFKSVNSITQYLSILERKNYLIRNCENKLVLDDSGINYEQYKKIKVINLTNAYTYITLNKNKNYLAYKIHNDYFFNQGILRNDLLIIEQKNKLKQHDIGLFIIDKKYRIMIYDYQDGFYILKDNEELLLNKVKIIGKVIMIERKL